VIFSRISVEEFKKIINGGPREKQEREESLKRKHSREKQVREESLKRKHSTERERKA
jgi:hypothetical protein